MKLKKSKLLQKSEGRKKAKYLITLEVTDHDIEMLEDLATCYCTEDNSTELKEEYSTWIKRVWHEFWKLWKRHDFME